jgi:predicted O-methyltransferase YrrM
MLNDNEWFNYQEFYDFISTHKFQQLVEIGVWKGNSISYLASKNPNSKIYAVDLFEKTYRYEKAPEVKVHVPTVYDVYNKKLTETNTRHLITDIKEFSWDGAAHFEDNSIDFAFIDADHSYEAVKKDISAWFPKIKKGGILAGHDYSIAKKSPHPGVAKAVNEFVKDKNIKLNLENGSVWWVIKYE